MNLVESMRVARDALAANTVRAALTMLGVIIGVMSVILLISLGQGAKDYVTNQFIGLGTNIVIITPGKMETTGNIPIIGAAFHKLTYEDAVAVERRAHGVKAVSAVIFGAGGVKYQNRKRDTSIVGVNSKFPQIRNLSVEQGAFFTEQDVEARRRLVALGVRVKQELFGGANPLGKWVKINQSPYRVVSVMARKGMSLGFDLDDMIFIPVTSASDLFDTDALFEILLEAESEREIETAKQSATAVLARRHNNTVDFTATAQGAMLAALQSVLDTLTYVLAGIAGISLIVGGIGIMNIMLVSVRERTSEVGIRKAVGATNRDILSQFLVEAAALSGLGGLTGIVLGVGGAQAISVAIPSLPVTVTVWAILLAFLFSLAVGLFFGVYPARKASLLDPIEALRHE